MFNAYLLISFLCTISSIFYVKIYRPVLRLQDAAKSSLHLNKLGMNTLTLYDQIHKLPQEIQTTFALNILKVKDITLEQKDKDHVAHTAYYPHDPIICEKPTFHDYLSRKKKNKHKRDYSGLELNLLIFATQLLKHDIHVTYDGNPYVAFYIYKHFHKNVSLFNTIAADILSNDSTTIQSVGHSLLKILGNTIRKKLCSDPAICIYLVNDFKTVLVQKTSYFVFPIIQIASTDHMPIRSVTKNEQKISYERRFFHFNNQLMVRPLNTLPDNSMPTRKLYMCVNKDITAIYRALDDTFCTHEGPMPFVRIYTDIPHKKMHLMSLPGASYNPLDVNFRADYAIPADRKSSTDDIINTLLKKTMKLEPRQRSSAVIKKLYEKAETKETKKFIAWAYQNAINPVSLKKMLTWLLPITHNAKNTGEDAQLWCTQHNNALSTISIQTNNTIEVDPLFWKKHHKTKNEFSNKRHWLFIREDQFRVIAQEKSE